MLLPGAVAGVTPPGVSLGRSDIGAGLAVTRKQGPYRPRATELRMALAGNAIDYTARR